MPTGFVSAIATCLAYEGGRCSGIWRNWSTRYCIAAPTPRHGMSWKQSSGRSSPRSPTDVTQSRWSIPTSRGVLLDVRSAADGKIVHMEKTYMFGYRGYRVEVAE
jgi:hypothetical protein